MNKYLAFVILLLTSSVLKANSNDTINQMPSNTIGLGLGLTQYYEIQPYYSSGKVKYRFNDNEPLLAFSNNCSYKRKIIGKFSIAIALHYTVLKSTQKKIDEYEIVNRVKLLNTFLSINYSLLKPNSKFNIIPFIGFGFGKLIMNETKTSYKNETTLIQSDKFNYVSRNLTYYNIGIELTYKLSRIYSLSTQISFNNNLKSFVASGYRDFSYFSQSLSLNYNF